MDSKITTGTTAGGNPYVDEQHWMTAEQLAQLSPPWTSPTGSAPSSPIPEEDSMSEIGNEAQAPQVSGLSAHDDNLIVEFQLPGLRDVGASIADITPQVRAAIRKVLDEQEQDTSTSAEVTHRWGRALLAGWVSQQLRDAEIEALAVTQASEDEFYRRLAVIVIDIMDRAP